MPGGEIQIAAYGTEDFYLTSNPQISFFKSVYKRHTNFATEFRTIQPLTNTLLNFDSEVTITFEIGRSGDLMKDIYFVFTLPDIYSNGTDKFKWIKRLGEYIIKEVEFKIDNLSFKQTSEWLHIWNELNLEKDKVDGYNKMIGNINELYDPSSANPAGSYISGNIGAKTPSIRGRKIYVPLRFWFNLSYSSALPLVALQHTTKPIINITLRSIKELYTVISSTNYIQPNDTYKIGKYLNPTDATIGTLDINSSLEVNYISLANDERKRFALADEHQYLIQDVLIEKEKIDNTNTNFNINCKNLNHPTLFLSWMFRRTDLEDVNDWANFTNWCNEDTDPIYQLDNPYSTDDLVLSVDNNSLKNKNIMLDARLQLNNMDRFSAKDFSMFNLINNYQHNNKIPKDGIYVYSFSLHNKEDQPSGTCNMSNFEKKHLYFTLTDKMQKNYQDTSSSYQYNFMLYQCYYNILHIQGGVIDLKYAR